VERPAAARVRRPAALRPKRVRLLAEVKAAVAPKAGPPLEAQPLVEAAAPREASRTAAVVAAAAATWAALQAPVGVPLAPKPSSTAPVGP